jgi:hypothetical protein
MDQVRDDSLEQIPIEEDDSKVLNLAEQALWVFAHSLIAIGSWVAMMVAITLLKPDPVPVVVTLLASFVAPFLAGNIINRLQQNEMAPYTWLIGLIWFLIICLWVLDMPTGPNQCYHCDASQKMVLTFFSMTEDSGLIDGNGRLVGTWPAAAFIGYGIGAGLVLKKKKRVE